MEFERTNNQLQREVLIPQPADQRFGVVMVAATAMFIAVMTSGFMLQSRSVRTCPGASYAVQPATTSQVTTQTTTTPQLIHDVRGGVWVEIDLGAIHRTTDDQANPEPCGPMYRENPDGSVQVSFTACPDDIDGRWGLRHAPRTGADVVHQDVVHQDVVH